MRFKRLLALLLAAALALSLLAGCGGGKNQSLSQMLLNLLDGQYQNVSVEIDSDLETKLRQAISESETDEELRAALEQLLGGGISFQRLGSGQQGDSAWTLIIYPGTDPDAAARSVYLDLDKVFAALPDDGQYSSGFAMVEMENGYAILVRATVDRAGTEDKPEPVTLKSIAVTQNPELAYWVGQSFDPTGMVITATYSNNTTKTLKDIKKNGDQGVKWTPETFDSDGTKTVTISYGGQTATVTVEVKKPTVDILTVETATSSYTAGDSFTLGDITKVTATYTNNKTETVLPENCDFYLGSTKITPPHQFTTVGSYTLKVSYEGGTAEIPLTVNFGTVTSITVSGNYKKEYELNETFDSAGLKVTAYDGYGNSKTVTTGYTITITDENNKEVGSSNPFATAGTYTLTVEYNGITSNSITITVVDKGYTDDGEGNYTVTTAEGLEAVAELVNGGKTNIDITLTSDITLTEEWTPIGNYEQQYTGTFNGKDKTITGLTVTESYEYAGLFGYIGENGTVKNVVLEGVKIESDHQYANVGGVAGYCYKGTLENCSVSGSVSSNYSAGGVVGQQYSGSITLCSSSATVKGTGEVGGVAGKTDNSATLTACYATGNVTFERASTINTFAGGVVGLNGTGSILTACYATGNVTGTGTGTGSCYVGGVTGDNASGTLTACYHATGTVSGPDGATGGVTGRNYTSLGAPVITACYWGNNGQTQGIGYNQAGTGETTPVTAGDWSNAYNAMNTALAEAGSQWCYSSTGTLIKQ